MSSNQSSVSKAAAEVSKVRCHCNLVCVLYPSHKEKSIDRKFIRCPRNRSKEDCEYFMWVDEDDITTVEKENQSKSLQTITSWEKEKISRELAKISNELRAIRTENKVIMTMLIIFISTVLMLFGIALNIASARNCL